MLYNFFSWLIIFHAQIEDGYEVVPGNQMFDSVRQSITVSGAANQDLDLPSTGPLNTPPELSSIDRLQSHAELHQI